MPEGWTERRNSYGNPKLVNGNEQIDYIPLSSIQVLRLRGLEPTINNFLMCNPLTVQAVVFDVREKKLVGERGIEALQRRVVEVLDREIAEKAAQKKGKSLRDYIQEKAKSLGFRPIFPE